MSELVINGLLRKRKELALALASHDKARDALVSDIEAVDRAIVICGQSRPKPVRMFAMGQLRRMIGDIRRINPDIGKPREITAAVIDRMGWDSSDRALVQRVRQKVKDSIASVRANRRRSERRRSG